MATVLPSSRRVKRPSWGTSANFSQQMIPPVLILTTARLPDLRKIADPFFRASPWRDLATYLLGFLDPRMRYYVFSFSDPRPLLRDLGQIVRKALRRDKS